MNTTRHSANFYLGVFTAIVLAVSIIVCFVGFSFEKAEEKRNRQMEDYNAVALDDSVAWDKDNPYMFSFRKTNWLMSPEEVISTEGVKPNMYSYKHKFMRYSTKFMGRKMELLYHFNDESKLERAEYHISSTHSGMSDTEWIALYEEMHKRLVLRFGEACIDDEQFKTDDPKETRLAKWSIVPTDTEIVLSYIHNLGFSVDFALGGHSPYASK